MRMITSFTTDIGTTKNINQDSVFAHNFTTTLGDMALAVICDGMGGYSKGEVASAALLNAFYLWEINTLPALLCGSLDDFILREQWNNILCEQNKRIRLFGIEQGITLGTTITALLVTRARWHCVNVGDTRAYEFTETVSRLTRDQTYVEKEMSMGRMTREEAESSSLRNALLQCVGIDEEIVPEFAFGDTKSPALYMLCSDGFRHVINEKEMLDSFNANKFHTQGELALCEKRLIDINKKRGEKDNISVATILVN